MATLKTLAQKLGIKPSSTIVALNANPGVLDGIKSYFSEGVILATTLPLGRVDMILAWLKKGDDLPKLFRKLQDSIVPDGAIWAVIPKKIKGKAVGVTFEEAQSAALRLDLVDNKTATFSDSEYGIRYVMRKERRPV